ncbi:hypothetical protein NITHO_3510004 [Nitrolancea hollandica Lb]|uniref:Uncharacterized protein n=1 Tax=Nitrolancea hollandica Lb TaxID=1129897 RepID=I4EII7_9BACT|nr:hypothetical protein NITHO_3510004 [Nitrolancea hollandica Lb]
MTVEIRLVVVDRTGGKSWHRWGYWLRSEGKTPNLLLAPSIPANVMGRRCRVQPIMTRARWARFAIIVPDSRMSGRG